MKKFKKFGILTLSTGLSIGMLAPGIHASAIGNQPITKAQVQVSQAEKLVTKNDLLKIFREAFPQFKEISDNDFHMSSGHHYPEDNTVRYELSFHKNINGKQEYGNVGFIGEKLDIERFYYQPSNVVDALFPAKVSKEKAKEVAQAFLKTFPESSEYQLNPIETNYYPTNSILTEPIRYMFSFNRTKNNVVIPDQQIQITVLGNGQVTEYYRGSVDKGNSSFDDVTKALPKNDIIAKIKENLSVDLVYGVDYDFETGERKVKLAYQPSSGFIGVNALTGEWQTVNGFTKEFPKGKAIEVITKDALPPKQANITLEAAKALAEKLLAVDSKDVKLKIESVEETKNYNGQDVININYMYEYRNGGSGTNLEINKHTGEIIQYHDMKSDLLPESTDKKEPVKEINSQEALAKAIEYLKQYSPSILHNYAIPTVESYKNEDRGFYHFSFPRVVNGILVNGDQLSVTVTTAGDLQSLNTNQTDIKEWPSIDKVISKEKAKAKFLENLNLDTHYSKVGKEKDQYRLIYTPTYSDKLLSTLDANTGEWINYMEKKFPVVTHPQAEKELNYLLEAGIMKAKDDKTFDANAKMTKGEALEVTLKSLSRIYREYPNPKNQKQTFENINPEHPLYPVVERAVSLGVIKKDAPTINLDETLTKEELAVWYIRILKLTQAAENHDIYQLKFADSKDVKPENIGYVALAHSLGLLTTTDNQFKPKQEVTYADIALSSVRLAHEAYKKGIELYY